RRLRLMEPTLPGPAQERLIVQPLFRPGLIKQLQQIGQLTPDVLRSGLITDSQRCIAYLRLTLALLLPRLLQLVRIAAIARIEADQPFEQTHFLFQQQALQLGTHVLPRQTVADGMTVIPACLQLRQGPRPLEPGTFHRLAEEAYPQN